MTNLAGMPGPLAAAALVAPGLSRRCQCRAHPCAYLAQPYSESVRLVPPGFHRPFVGLSGTNLQVVPGRRKDTECSDGANSGLKRGRDTPLADEHSPEKL
jgi:hypothetical protein